MKKMLIEAVVIVTVFAFCLVGTWLMLAPYRAVAGW